MSSADVGHWPTKLTWWLRRLAPLVTLSCILSAQAASTNNEEVIVPNRVVGSNAAAAGASTGTGALTMVGVIVLGGAGAWLLWRGRAGGLKQFSRVHRQLNIEETRSLGNRQFLVVATYQDKKFLIGVCPGRIDMLSTLHAATPVEERLAL